MVPMWKKMKAMTGKGKEGGPEATRSFSMVRLLYRRWGSRMELNIRRRHGRETPIS
jgi:hypothetical protein